MAITLQITDSTTTIDLSAVIVEYTIKSPRESPDGKPLISETIQAEITDTTLALAIAKIHSLERLLAHAPEYANDSKGAAVYLQFRVDGSLTLMRSLIISGSVDDDREALGYQLAGYCFAVTVNLNRIPVREGDTEVELSTPTTGEAIVNHTDGGSGHVNYFDIAAAAVGGVSRAPCRLEITNNTPSTTLGKIFVGINAQQGSAPVGLTSTAISFDSASKEIRGTGLMGVFAAGGGQTIVITGSASNNKTVHSTSADANKIVVTESLTDESAGASVTVVTRCYTMPTHQIECGDMTGMTPTAAETVTNTGISFDAASKEIRGTGLMGVFAAGGKQEIVVSGSASNNGTYHSVSATADKIVVVESLVNEGAGASDTVTVKYSNGSFGLFTTASSSTIEIGRITLSASDLAKFAGNFFHALMRDAASNNGIYAQLKVCYTGTTVALAEAPEVLLGTESVHDLGALQIPPYLRGTITLTAVDIVLFGRKSGGFTIKADFIHFFGADAWRVYTPVTSSVGVAKDATLKDDSALLQTYVLASSNKSAHYNAMGEPLMLYPGQDHRVYVLAMLTNGSAPIGQSMTCKLFYRPAYLTL